MWLGQSLRFNESKNSIENVSKLIKCIWSEASKFYEVCFWKTTNRIRQQDD